MNTTTNAPVDAFGAEQYQNITNIHPLALIMIVIMGFAVLQLPRTWAVIPMFIIVCFVSSVQKITVASMDFNLLRILVVFGFMRVFARREYKALEWKNVDTAIILWVFFSVSIYILQWKTSSAVINRLGFAFDAIGMYFFFRCTVRDWTDLNNIVTGIIVISVPVAMLFLFEKSTGRNLFSVFGGVPAYTAVRDGRLRCQGAFPHPIIAGCFWAATIPLIVTKWWKSDKDRTLAIIGLVSALTIIVCVSSSTPLLGAMAGFMGFGFLIFRKQMRPIRWIALAAIIALDIVMEARVWHLIARVGVVSGSTAHFRYMLIDATIRNFREWALLGTRATAHWFWGAEDLTNQYIFEAVQGGLLTLTFFVVVIAYAYKDIGNCWKLNRSDRYPLIVSWALGATLFVHCVNFIGVSYFGQIWILWYLLLAAIASLENKAVIDKKPVPIAQHA